MTEAIEYRTIDKSAWMRGPWDNEPDKAQWQDEVTGLPCLIVRGPLGALCGYVGVTEGHPWFRRHYDSVGMYEPEPEGYVEDWYVNVHGGLTFSGACQHGEDPSEGICHIPAPGQSDNVWWLGFDCSHYDDLTGINREGALRDRCPPRGQYRDFNYVREECRRLAAQATEARRAATPAGSVHESAVPQACAQPLATAIESGSYKEGGA